MKRISPFSTVANRLRHAGTPGTWSAAGAADHATDASMTVTPLPPMRELLGPVSVVDLHDDGGGRVEAPPDEEGMPRWLRPSLREARLGPTSYRGWAD